MFFFRGWYGLFFVMYGFFLLEEMFVLRVDFLVYVVIEELMFVKFVCWGWDFFLMFDCLVGDIVLGVEYVGFWECVCWVCVEVVGVLFVYVG